MKSKFISFLTAVCMAISILPQTASAAMTGSGTAADPYQISTAADLFEFAQKVNGGDKDACAKLMANIDMKGQATWTTICETGLYWNGYPTDGTMDDGYSGVFDGQGHTIDNLALASSTTRDASCGLFGTVSGTIKNLKITNTTFTHNGHDIRVGSIVGQLIKPTGLISDCVVTDATLTPGKHVVGGIAGCAYEARIENCMVLNTKCTGDRVGAIVADTRADNGADDMKATVVNCYSNSRSDLPSVVGTQSGTIIDCETVPWSMVTSGELAYLLQNGNSTSIWGQNLGTDGNDIPTFNDPKVYKNTCVDVTFYSNTNQSHTAHNYSNSVCTHCGAAKTPPQSSGVYQIGSADQLFAFATIANSNKTANAVLTADIDLQGKTWTTICSTGLYWKEYGTDVGYAGTFDGQGHVIKNLALASSTTADATCGLFGTASGTVKNLGIEGVTFTDNGKDYRVGAVVGQLIKTGHVTNCYAANMTVPENNRVAGGIAGCVYEGTIDNCMVYGSEIHGLVTTSKNEYRYGYIVGDTRADNSTTDRVGIVTNCYTDGDRACGSQTGTITTCESGVTAERFGSGEIAYLLNGSKTDGSWGQGIGSDGYPRLGGAKVYKTTCVGADCYANRSAAYTYHSYVNGKCIRCGDEPLAGQSGTYKIATADQMCAFSSIVNGGNNSVNAELTADITVSTDGGFVPIGTDANKYGGTFDGKNHTLTVNLSGGENISPFAWVSGATVKNLTVDGTISVTGKYAAGIASEPRTKFTLTNCISDVDIYSTLADDGTHGGLVGNNDSATTITNCAFTGSITGANTYACGGFIGWCDEPSTINNSYIAASFDVNTQDCYTFSRNPSKATITNCYYLTALGTANTGAAQLTSEQFASGEAAFKLNESKSNGAWKQTLTKDAFPNFTGSAVYQNTCADVAYLSNTQGSYTAHEYDANDTCIHCGTVDTFQPVDGVYQIRTAEQLKMFARMVNGGQTGINGKLVKDIDLSKICGEGKGNWTPIGDLSHSYNGTFDGQGYTVSNLYINNTSSDRQGLFGDAESGAVIKNLNVSGTVSGSQRVGGVVGFLVNSTVTGCSFSGTVSGTNDVGGIVGYNNGTVNNCCNTGTVSGTNNVGGVVGLSNANTTVSNCYNIGTVSGTNDVGGIVGTNFATVTNCCYLEGGAAGEGTAKTAEQFASGEVAWLLNNADSGVWKQTIGTDAYPTFTGGAVYKNTCGGNGTFYSNTDGDFAEHALTDGVCTRCGTEDFQLVDGVYQIRTAEQLKKFADMVNSGQSGINGKLMNNIDLSKICGEGIGNWTPIGNKDNKYTGTFDGQGYTVSGLYINDATAGEQGLFGHAGDKSEIKNLNVSGTVNGGYIYVGGVVGYISFGKVTNCSFSGSVTSSNNYVGGITGATDYAAISNCYSTGSVNAAYGAGGIIGFINESDIIGCYSTAAVSGSGTIGGVIGLKLDSTSTNCCYLTGTAAGGINGADAAGQAVAKTAEQFASGEVAYLLNGSKTDGVWGQTLTGDAKQNAPVLGGAKVYTLYNKCQFTGYTNDATATVTPTDHTYVDGVCSVCGAADVPTIDGVYQIGTAQQLKTFAQIVNNGEKNANAVLTADIDLNNEAWTTICETPLYHQGYGEDLGYAGTFDGAGHTISNLALVSSSTIDSSCGLFGTVSGTVKNLHIYNATLAKDGGKDMRTGAVVGQLITANGLVTDCLVTESRITPGEHVTGGIAGAVYEGRVENCLVLLTAVTGTNNRYGLIVGDTRGDISNTDRFGTVTNCYTDGTNGTPIASGQSGTITGCNGSVSNEQLASGEIAVLLQNGRETTAWGQILKTDSYPKPGSPNRVYLNYTDCIHKEYSNNAGGSPTPIAHKIGEDGLCTVCGLDIEGRFVISSFDKLKDFATRVNNGETDLNAVMTADIEATSDGGFVPIGTDAKRYGGTFDGQGHTLTLDISGGESMGAPFAYATGATVKNLTTAGTIKANGKYAAGFVSRSNNVTLENCLSKVTIDSAVNGDGTHGGLIGTVNGTADKPVTITNCGFVGAINGSNTNNCGGLIGWTDRATASNITNSYVAATFGVKADGSDTFSRNPNYAALTNCYYLTAIGATHGTQLTAAQFASGEAAWRMNNADGGVWKQTIGTDAFPSFAGAAVYKNSCVGVPIYGNTDVDYNEHVFDGDYCTRCGALKPLDPDADGTYHITTAMELAKFAYMVNSGSTDINGKLMNDIDLSEICGADIGNWTPIGNAAKDYRGTFDGQGFTVSGLYINDATAGEQGLFGHADDKSEIKNLNVSGTVNGGYIYVGGVVGYINFGKVTNCSFSGSVTSSNNYVGGITGATDYAAISNCYSTGSVNAAYGAGGIIGFINESDIIGCYSTAAVSGSGNIGGVIGLKLDSTSTNCCYLAGTAAGGINGADAAGQAEVKTAEQFASGEVAWLLNDADSGVWKQTLTGDTPDAYPNFTGGTVYKNTCGSNGTFYSNTDGDYDEHDFDANGVCTRCGAAKAPTQNADGVYEISTAGQLKAFAGLVNSGQKDISGKLMNDINLSSVCGAGVGDWTPIGSSSNNYDGTFDGQDFTVSGLYINNTSADYHGLFGGTYFDAVVKNLHVDGTVSGNKFVGGVIGNASDSTIANCSFSGTVSGNSYVGGIIGNAINDNTVTNCCNTGSVSGTGENIGGVIGKNWGLVSNCCSIGKVSGGSYVGGVVGFLFTSDGGTVTNCYYLTGTAKGGIKGADAAGQAEVKTSAQFASGEVAWLLNGSQTDGAWGQTLTGEGKQDFPTLDGDKVYSVNCVDQPIYSNTSENYTAHDFDANGICTRCGAADAPTQNADGVYEISTAGQLKAFADMVNGGQIDISGKLMNNIDLSSVCGAGVGDWTPIGSSDNKYDGTFDGQGFTVSGLYINNTSADYQGLFGSTYFDAVVKNLHVDGTVSGNKFVGGVIGNANDSTISNCSFSGTVSGNSYVGGILGNAVNKNTVTNCCNTGSVSGTGEYIGGVIGKTWGLVSNCCSIGKVSGGTAVGGVVGFLFTLNDGTVTNCYYLTGTAAGGIDGADAAGNAEVKTAAQFASGEVAYLLQGEQTEPVWGQTLTGEGRQDFPTLGGDKVYQNNCGSYVFYDNTGGKHYDAHTFVDGVCTQCGTHDTPTLVDGVYEIRTAYQLKAFAEMVNSGQGSISGKLMNDIDLSEVCGAELGNWTPIGGENNSYKGKFDGQGYTVSGLYINNTVTEFQGLFGYTDSGTVIKNLTVDGSVSGKKYVGGIVGFIKGEVSNCRNTAAVSGEFNVGGIAGLNNSNSTINNCCNTGSISSDHDVGGVVGQNIGTATNCCNIGSVSGESYVGGVAGSNNLGGTSTNCYYLTGTAAGGINGADTDQTVAKTAEQFASGEVAYLLNGGTSEGAWGQNLTGENKDKFPVLGGAAVYNNRCGDNEYYGNTDESFAEHDFADGVCTHCGAVDTPQFDGNVYRIKTPYQMKAFADMVNNGKSDANAVLDADIDLTVICGAELGSWTPIGSDGSYGGPQPYTGIFDGQGHTVSGLYVNNPDSKFQGLFGLISSGAEVNNVSVSGTVSGQTYVGGVVGCVGNNRGVNCTVSGCSFAGSVSLSGTSEYGGAGGITGCIRSGGTVTNCYNTGSVSGSASGNDYIGGIAGYIMSGTVTKCYSTGKLSGSANNGITGNNVGGTVTGCYYLEGTATGGIKGTDVEGQAEVKTAEQFALGEVAWLLNNENHGWGQRLAGKYPENEIDAYPILSSDSNCEVCQVRYHIEDLEQSTARTEYVNCNSQITLPESPDGIGWLVNGEFYADGAVVTITHDTMIESARVGIIAQSELGTGTTSATANELTSDLEVTSAADDTTKLTLTAGTLIYTIWVKVYFTDERPTIEIKNADGTTAYAKAAITKSEILSTGEGAGYYCVQIEQTADLKGGSVTFGATKNGAEKATDTITLN